MSLWYSMNTAEVYDSTATPPLIRQILVRSTNTDITGLTETHKKYSLPFQKCTSDF